MNYYIVRETQERFFVVRALHEEDAMDAVMEAGCAEYNTKWQVITIDFDNSGGVDSREIVLMPFEPNWKWNTRGNAQRIKARAASAGAKR
jgi:hypothetical protein